MDAIFLFGAEKLFLLSPLIAAVIFFRLPRDVQTEMVIFAFFSLPLTFMISLLARELYYNPLPFVVGGYDPLLDHAPNNGFPSDHTLLLAAIASVFTFFHKRTAIALWTVTVLVGLSRMYVGVHHLIDIVGAIFIALLSAMIVHAVLLWRKSV